MFSNMKAIDIGSEPANRLLNLLATYVSKKMPWLPDQWIAGDIEMDFNYVFLGENSRPPLDSKDVPNVLAYLDTAGCRPWPSWCLTGADSE